MLKEIVKVENPLYMTYDEIREKFWGKQVLMTDMEFTDESSLVGGVVRAWGTRAMMELWRLLDEEYSAEPGKCTVEYIGTVPLFLYAGLQAGGEVS